MGKQQRTLEEMFGGTSNANQNENTPTENQTLEEMFGGTESTVDTQPVSEEDQQAKDLEERRAQIKKIDAMSGPELVKYIDSLPTGRTKSDKPLPDKATGPAPTQKFQESALFLGNMPELKESVIQEIKDEGMLAMGDNASVVAKFKNIFGDEWGATGKYIEDFLNPAAFKSMAEYAGNEELKTDFNNAYNLTSQFANKLTEANRLKNELRPYLEETKQAETNEQAADLNLKFKRLQQLTNELGTYLNEKKNDKGEIVQSDMIQAIENVRNQNTWRYGSIDDDRFGFDDNGKIVTGKEFKRTTEQILVRGDSRTDAAGTIDEPVAFKSINNIDNEFSNLYKAKVDPIYGSFLENAVKKLDSKNPDHQRQAFDMLLGVLRGTDLIPYPERAVERVRNAGDYDAQLKALKRWYTIPFSDKGNLTDLMQERTSEVEKSNFVLMNSRTAFGQDASNYPTTFNDEQKSQSDWMTFATNGTLKQLQTDKEEWSTSARKIRDLMRSRVDVDDDIKNAIDAHMEVMRGGSTSDGRLPQGINHGRDILVEATQNLIQDGRILTFPEWLNYLRKSGSSVNIRQGSYNNYLGIGDWEYTGKADKFSYLFGYMAEDQDTDSFGHRSIYLDDNGIPAPVAYQKNPKLAVKKGYTAWEFSPVRVGNEPMQDEGGDARPAPVAHTSSYKSIVRAKNYYDAATKRIKDGYDDLQVTQANNTTLKLAGLGNFSSRGLANFGLDLRMAKDGKGAALQNTLSQAPDLKDEEGIKFIEGGITDQGFADPKLKITNKHKNVQNGIFSIIAPQGEFIDYNDTEFVDQFTRISGPFSAHVNDNNLKNIVTVTDKWDNNAMGSPMFINRESAFNKDRLEAFFHKKEKESDKDYEKRMGEVEMEFRRIGMVKDNATYKFTDGDGKSIFVNIPWSHLKATGENFYKYTGKSVGEKEFEITGRELLPMPKLENGDNAFDNKELYLEVNGKGEYIVPITYTDENDIERSYDMPTGLYKHMVMLPQARNLARELLTRVVDEVIQPIND